MECILCLQNDASLSIHSKEGELLEIQRIIEMHFWLRLGTANEAPSKVAICKTCWQLLFSFHEFYLHVEQVHKQHESLVIVNTRHIETTTYNNNPLIKEEPLVIRNEPLPVVRRRGRPCKSVNTKSNQATPLILTEEVIIDQKLSIPELNEEPQPSDSDNLYEDGCNYAEVTDVVSSSDGDASTNDKLPLKKCDRGRAHPKNTLDIRTSEAKKATLSDLSEDQVQMLAIDHSVSESETTQKDLLCKKTLISKQNDSFIAANLELKCCLCQEPLADFTKLKAHFRKQHSIEGYIICCGLRFKQRGPLVDHIHTHIDPLHFKCPRCDKVLSTRWYLETHLKAHDDTPGCTYRCETCAKTFRLRTSLERHKLWHVSEEQKKFVCLDCAKTFITNYQMRGNLRLVHMKIDSKICDNCGKSIRGRLAFKRHQDVHKSVQQPSIQCDRCNLTFVTEYGLTRHIRALHTAENIQPQTCPICEKVSPNRSALRHHIRFMHNLQKSHACSICSKTFKRPKSLKEHMTTHTGEDLYTCPHCPRTFKSNGNMHSHRKKAHRLEWEKNRKQKRHCTASQQSEVTPIPTAK